jgi:hypothetical protein
MDEIKGVYFIGVVDLQKSTDEKLNIVRIVAFAEPPGAWEYYSLRKSLENENDFKNIISHIILIPFSEDVCRTEEEVVAYKQLVSQMENAFKEQKKDGEETVDVIPT